MKRFLLCACLLFPGFFCLSQDLGFYLPDSVRYDPAVPRPKDVIHHEVGEWHVTHDRLVQYMKTLAAAVPGRMRIETMGYTYEQRPQVLLIITSPENHRRLEEIRLRHLDWSDPSKSGSATIDEMPVVLWIGNSIHGNEASGANAGLLTAYHLAAAQGEQIEEILRGMIILFDPSFNPDGLQRFSTWVNQHKSKNLVSDINSREFNEVWPGGRFNHYWFDLNRDWLPAVHLESQNRLNWFHKWKPNVLTDHHEQGSNATFFFQPGVPSRVNPLTPAKNQELTGRLAKFHAQYLDRIGSLYFTRENYDDFYYGKGSTYPDINGSIGILFEQASSRGHLQQTTNGLLSFPFTIRNQFITSLSTIEGTYSLRKELLAYQRDFFRQSLTAAQSASTKAWVFGSGDETKTKLFFQMLSRHGIRGGFLTNDLTVDGRKYRAHRDMIVPMVQPQYMLLRTLFEKNLQYQDSLFYDITSWTMPLAFGIHASPTNTFREEMMENPFTRLEKPAEIQGGRSEYAYLVEWTDYYAPAALYEILQKGIMVKVANNAFRLPVSGSEKEFPRGTLLIPVSMQSQAPGRIFEMLNAVTGKYALRTYAVSGGLVSSGSDLGSSRFAPIVLPHIAMLTGTGVNATDAGEVWHLMDQRMNIPVTHLDISVFNRIDLSRYNTLIMVGGSYSELNKDKLKEWVRQGGLLILTEEANTWAGENNISSIKFKKPRAFVDSLARLPYADRTQIEGAQQVNGAIFGASVDLTHPLAYGYSDSVVSLFKANRVFIERSRNPFATPFYYGNRPLQSGWISQENAEAVKNSAAVLVQTQGNGRVIHISDNPNFRAFWLGGTKLFMNAIFFGRMIEAASARAEE